MKNIAETIKEGRRKLGLTQEELAEKLFVTRQAVSGWERGKNLPDIEKLKLISEMFGSPLDDMLFEDNKSVRRTNMFYKYLVLVFIGTVISMVSIGLYQIFNPPHIVLLRDYRGVCSNEQIVVTYYESRNTYRVSTNESITFPFGEYCVPLQFEVSLGLEASEETKLQHSFLGSMGINLHNPEIIVKEEENIFKFDYATHFFVYEKINYDRHANKMINTAFTNIVFEIPKDMKDQEQVTVTADRTDEWEEYVNE